MRSILFVLAFICCLSFSYNGHCQDYKRESKTFVVTKAQTKTTKETKTDFVWKDAKGNEYPIYVGATGACYIKRVSAKSGNEYKQYLGAEISMQVCKELGIEYKGKKQD